MHFLVVNDVFGVIEVDLNGQVVFKEIAEAVIVLRNSQCTAKDAFIPARMVMRFNVF
jgi:hypothetical protein